MSRTAYHISFEPRTSGSRVRYQTSEEGCWSYLGFVNHDPQPINIGVGCESFGIVVHEILHALGFWHAQSRPDRDEWITLNRG